MLFSYRSFVNVINVIVRHRYFSRPSANRMEFYRNEDEGNETNRS